MAEIMVCGECGKVFRFEERGLERQGAASDEPIPCPYGTHPAGSRASAGWWESLPMSPAEQEAWRGVNPGEPASM